MSTPAVQVVNGVKTYGAENASVLKNLNMQVDQGTMWVKLDSFPKLFLNMLYKHNYVFRYLCSVFDT